MSGIRGAKALTVCVGLSSFLLLADTIEKTPSVADCSFQVDPDRFLSQEGRVRREVNDRVLKMARSARAPIAVSASPPRSGNSASVAHRARCRSTVDRGNG